MDTSQTYFYKLRYEDKNLSFFIFDVWGDENAISRYLDQTNSIIIVYDVSDYKTCKSNNKWLTLLRKNIGNSQPIIVLAGNKCDLTEQKLTNISIKDGKTFADNNKLLFMETSALNNINIYEMFTLIAKELMRTKNPGISDVNSIIQINECSNNQILLKEKAQQVKYKVIILGDSGVGKTSLTKKLISDKFNEKYATTVNVEFYRHEEFINSNTKIKFDIWDTCGSERFNTLNAFYYRNSDAVILMYDISNKTTFDDLHVWRKQLEQHIEDYRDLFIAVVGVKYDLIDSRQVKYEKAKSFAEQNQY
jgi:small GTP-binding protein